MKIRERTLLGGYLAFLKEKGLIQLTCELNTQESNLIIQTLGSFSIDDGNGSENVSVKMNSSFFNLCRVYSNLLKMASVREFTWS